MEKSNSHNDELKFAYMVLNYLMRNPDAKDTISGISQWWILSEVVDNTVDRVDRALRYLKDEGFIKVLKPYDSESYYCINDSNKKTYQ